MKMRQLRTFFATLAAFLVVSSVSSDGAVADELGTRTFVTRALDAHYAVRPVKPLRRWTYLLAALDAEAKRVLYCQSQLRCRDIGARPLASLLSSLPRNNQRELIERVNRYFNSFPHVADEKAFRAQDRWLSPIDFVQTSGDCEDYAIAKYFVLRLIGIPDDRLQIILVRDERRRLDHAVLLVDLEGEVLVLDSLADVTVWEHFPHYRPIYAFNASTTWHFTMVEKAMVERSVRIAADRR